MSYFEENPNWSRKLFRQFINMVLPAKVATQQDTQKLYTVFSLYLFPTESNNNWLKVSLLKIKGKMVRI